MYSLVQSITLFDCSRQHIYKRPSVHAEYNTANGSMAIRYMFSDQSVDTLSLQAIGHLFCYCSMHQLIAI